MQTLVMIPVQIAFAIARAFFYVPYGLILLPAWDAARVALHSVQVHTDTDSIER